MLIYLTDIHITLYQIDQMKSKLINQISDMKICKNIYIFPINIKQLVQILELQYITNNLKYCLQNNSCICIG